MESHERSQAYRHTWNISIEKAYASLSHDDLLRASCFPTHKSITQHFASIPWEQVALLSNETRQDMLSYLNGLSQLNEFMYFFSSRITIPLNFPGVWGLAAVISKDFVNKVHEVNRVSYMIRQLCYKLEIMNNRCKSVAPVVIPLIQESCLEMGLALVGFLCRIVVIVHETSGDGNWTVELPSRAASAATVSTITNSPRQETAFNRTSSPEEVIAEMIATIENRVTEMDEFMRRTEVSIPRDPSHTRPMSSITDPEEAPANTKAEYAASSNSPEDTKSPSTSPAATASTVEASPTPNAGPNEPHPNLNPKVNAALSKPKNAASVAIGSEYEAIPPPTHPLLDPPVLPSNDIIPQHLRASIESIAKQGNAELSLMNVGSEYEGTSAEMEGGAKEEDVEEEELGEKLEGKEKEVEVEFEAAVKKMDEALERIERRAVGAPLRATS